MKLDDAFPCGTTTIEKLATDTDYLRERVCDALVAIGTPEVVQKVAARARTW